MRGEICESLNFEYDSFGKLESGEYKIAKALESLSENNGIDFKAYIDAALHIRDALPLAISIDNFIDNHRENSVIAECGKLAIVSSILEAERKCHLFLEHHAQLGFDYNELEKQTWLYAFFQLITENLIVEEVKERLTNISLIIFNYDRCVEHFLHHAFQYFYKISSQKAAELVLSLNIYHPYGSVGKLPFLDSSELSMPFGGKPSVDKLIELSEGIKTFTEGTDPSSSSIQALREKIRESNQIAFLGFAFHKLNMELIASKVDFSNTKSTFASTLGISGSGLKVVLGQINSISGQYSNKPQWVDSTCKEFFDEFGRSLSY